MSAARGPVRGDTRAPATSRVVLWLVTDGRIRQPRLIDLEAAGTGDVVGARDERTGPQVRHRGDVTPSRLGLFIR
jgi:hypothetical protein